MNDHPVPPTIDCSEIDMDTWLQIATDLKFEPSHGTVSFRGARLACVEGEYLRRVVDKCYHGPGCFIMPAHDGGKPIAITGEAKDPPQQFTSFCGLVRREWMIELGQREPIPDLAKDGSR